MRTIILSKLDLIEEEHNVKILFSCESGSRGWKFPSADSDFDVRFIYIRPVNDYLSISNQADHLGFPINDELDIYGWDLKKVLSLARKSNTTAFEWLQSPVVYRELGNFKEELWTLFQNFFSCKTNVHHYLGLVSGAIKMPDNEKISIKRLFYVLRSLLSAKWCLEKMEIAPMTIDVLMSQLPLRLQDTIQSLIQFKAAAVEHTMVKIDPELRDYIEEEFIRCGTGVKELEKQQFNTAQLDEFFVRKIKEYDY